MDNELEVRIRQEIAQAGGAISLARFMELALYAPGLGYYERSSDTVGRRGDFYTSVSVGPVFGELLAFRFATILDELGPSARPALVEAGAHIGRLAADMLTWFAAHRPDLASHLQFWIVEPSTVRQRWQEPTLKEFGTRVRWVDSLATLREQAGGLHGILYSNELLDAFPVHRLAWAAAEGRWREIGVAWEDERFQWHSLAEPSPAVRPEVERLDRLPTALRAVLPDGFSLETGPAATAWWKEAASILREGMLLTIDYGLTGDECLQPQRAAGTLRGYAKHHLADHPLAQPGAQDLTAHVNFTALQEAGEAAGLHTEALTGQRVWLTEILADTLKKPGAFPDWNAARVRQFQTLTHPEHLGRAFRVLVQRRERSLSDALVEPRS